MKYDFFLSKLNNLSLNFGLILTKTSLIVFIIFVGQLGYIVMSDSEKIEIIIFLVVKKRIKNTFRTKRYL